MRTELQQLPKYTPTVTAWVTPTGERQNYKQDKLKSSKFTEGDSDGLWRSIAIQPAKFIDPATGEPTDATGVPALKDGKQVGTYKLDPLTGEVTFTPNKALLELRWSTVQRMPNGTPKAAFAEIPPTVTQ